MTDISGGQFPVEQQERMFDAFNGFCAFPGCLDKMSEFHHKLPNTVANRNNFPLFICSPFNMWPCCRKHHVDGNRPKIREKEAQIYEQYLQKIQEGS
jgi:hypothetical protein